MSEIVHKLRRPVEFEGKTYEELKFDLETLTGRDFREAKRLVSKPGEVVGVLTMDAEVAAYLVAKAAKVPVELFDYIPAPDYAYLTQTSINFLLVSGFSELEARQMKNAKAAAE
jgi:hypothetical protein